ncbi:hypothetical protein AZI87_14655 [Bdellovibrio bacteriovorus]|uniref:Uncharacterized protein n=1 Tax=Bdellovibrio bacteriovorus TaxID=959 RepID=A0A162FVD8_BDEBC|nr:hypothetical protein [Bdellovibrio bacteriovorus]KYG62542.1 hypothetical protein AZI87_14655 [Bdellovibrio bacteriovorus]
MKKLILSVLVAVLSFQNIAWAQNADSACDTRTLAIKAKIYRQQAKDLRTLSEDFKDMHLSATRDNERSMAILGVSAGLLFIAEFMLVSEGAAVVTSTRGVIGKLAYKRAAASEIIAERAGSMVTSEFLSVFPVMASTVVTSPHLASLGASMVISSQVPELSEDQSIRQKQILDYTEKLLLSAMNDRREQQAQILSDAPHSFLDGLSLGALDRKWTYRMYENSVAMAEITEKLARLKSDELVQCSSK